jgi:CD63 antigen
METFPETRKKTNFGMKCMKYMLILINVLYLIISFLMISGATTLKVIFGQYYYILWSSSTIDSLSSLWIATGSLLLILSLFGIIAAVKESTLLTNIYGLLLSLIFILQMAAAITGFTLISKSDYIVKSTLNNLIDRSAYSYDIYNNYDIDWVQTTFQCCGNEGPSDWRNYGRYFPTTTTTEDFYESSTTLDYEVSSTMDSTTHKPLIKMPPSCCRPDSNYDKINYTCDKYFTRGCFGPLHEIVSESVMLIGSSALIIGVVQILGVVCSFMFARIIRRSKTNRDIQRWAIHEPMGFDRPATYADRVATTEVKPI